MKTAPILTYKSTPSRDFASADAGDNLKSTVLLALHHGSKTSSTERFIGRKPLPLNPLFREYKISLVFSDCALIVFIINSPQLNHKL
jgi:hypothetical protein